MDKRLLTVVMAAILVALVITGIFYQITVRGGSDETASTTELLVVAKTELPIGVMLTDADLTVVDFPADMYPQGGFKDIAEVIDRSITQPVLANDPITANRVTEKGAGFGLAPMIPEGFRAIAVAVNQVSGVSGFIIPGSRVDILLSASPDASSGEMLTTTVLENITVLSTGHRQQPNQNGQPENVPVVNMLMTPEDAELLTLATQEGRIQLILRNPKDDEESAADREAKRVEDLFRDVAPKKPARRTGPARTQRRVVKMEPPPPAIFHVEMIRGDKRTIEEVDGAEN